MREMVAGWLKPLLTDLLAVVLVIIVGQMIRFTALIAGQPLIAKLINFSLWLCVITMLGNWLLGRG